jgi:hypothetical protein
MKNLLGEASMRCHILLISSLIFLTSYAANAGEHSVPNPSLTPGDAAPNLSKDDVCAPGYGKNTHLPQIEEQKKVYAAYHLNGPMSGYCSETGGCVINRLIPASLGGTNKPANLWPMLQYPSNWGLADKVRLEEKLHEMVCSNAISLTEAQSAIASDWISTFQAVVGEESN